jgi:DNA-binding winged helix-turn-helix (wHTH) protein/tetratricopeptide (TPR) repeat protein
MSRLRRDMKVLTPGPTEILEFGPFQLFPDGRFLREGRRVPLSPKEWGVLRVLAAASGALVSKDALLAQVWTGETVSDASLVRAIYGLRRRLGLSDAGDEFIATSYGRGYWLNAPVRSAPGMMRPPFESGQGAPAWSGGGPVPPRVLEACQEARYYYRQRNVKRMWEAIRLYRLAAEWGPSYAPAHLGLVKCYLTLVASSVVSQAEGLPPAEAALDAASALDPDNPEVLAIRAAIVSGFEWRFAEAEPLFDRALHGPREAPDVGMFYARHLLLAGDAAGSASVLEQYAERDPLSPPVLALLGYSRFCAGHPGEALSAVRQALSLDGRSTEALCYFAIVAMHAGRRQEASAAGYRAYRQARRLAPVAATWAYLCAWDGRQEEARRLMREAAAGDFLAPGAMAVTAWALADAAETAGWIRRAVDIRCVWLPVACRDPRFAPALGHPDVSSALAATPFAPAASPRRS